MWAGKAISQKNFIIMNHLLSGSASDNLIKYSKYSLYSLCKYAWSSPNESSPKHTQQNKKFVVKLVPAGV